MQKNYQDRGLLKPLSPIQLIIDLIISNKTEMEASASRYFKFTLEPLIDGIPGLGHIKGVYHLTQNESEQAEASLIPATKSLSVMGSTVACLPGGLGAAVACATAGSVGRDAVITQYYTNKHKQYTPGGLFEYIDNFKNKHSQHFDQDADFTLLVVGATMGRGSKLGENRLKRPPALRLIWQWPVIPPPF